jgi:hypothetical protein
MVNALSVSNRVWLLTARPEKWRMKTVDWLTKEEIMVEGQLMRPENDYRQAPELKVAMATLYFGSLDAIDLVFDSREDVVSAFRSGGVSAFHSMPVIR